MKKLISFCLLVFVLAASALSCLAGSVPEDLLHSDGAQVFFGQVTAVDGDSITVVQKQNVKGDFVAEREVTYSVGYVPSSGVVVGKTYLCGYFDEINPLYLWRVSSYDTKTLHIYDDNDMAERMEAYLNEGDFDAAEALRRAKLGIEGEAEIAVIGSADGPTSVLVSSPFPLWLVVLGLAVVGTVICLMVARRK